MDKRTRGVTRRSIAAAAIGAPLLAQTPESKPPDDTQIALDRTRQTSEQLRKFRTPVLLEPAFMFRA